jgi:phosphoenolpyruvate---glycerone phosphotransferase subunit DhaL
VELRAADLAAIARRLAGAFAAERDRLNELDAKLGDGDHGLSMARGFSAVADLLEAQTQPSITEALLQAGSRFNEISGSTIGILMYSAMREAGKAVAGKEGVGLPDLATMLEAAVGGIRKRGKADVGQKTILDSLHPALTALRASLAAGAPEEQALRDAAQAAADGAERTRHMESTVGRARWFAERSKGEIDPGAVSGAIIVKTVVSCLLREG